MNKKILLLILSVSMFSGLFSQYCGVVSTCTPAAVTGIAGLTPTSDQLPCVVRCNQVNQVIQFENFTTAQGYNVNWLRIDSIVNLPSGLCWKTNKANNTFNGGQTGCIEVVGTTSAPPGQYSLAIWVSVNVTAFGFPLTQQGNAQSLAGLYYWVRVKCNQAATCPALDTITGKTSSFIAYPACTAPLATISGPTSICSGSITLTAAAGADKYKWSTGATTQSISVSSTGTYKVTAYAGCDSAVSSNFTVSPGSASASISPTSPSFCSGGSVTLTASPAGATYAWSGGGTAQTKSVSTAGTYTVTVNQGGCTATASVNVTQISTTTPSVSPATSQICPGGSTILTASPAGATYAWGGGGSSQTLSVNAAGTYTVTVTQSGCTATASASVTVGSLSAAISPASPTFCPGGSVTLDAGAGYSSYAWSGGGASQTKVVSTAGTYTVTVTSSTCTATASVNVIQSSSLSPTIGPASPTICAGGAVTLDAGAGYTAYAWSGGGTSQTKSVSSAGTYTVTVSQGSCTGTASINVASNPTITTPTISPNATSVCIGDNVTLTATSGYTTYSWSNSLGSSATANTTGPGTYTVSVTQTGYCGTGTASITISQNPDVVNPSISAIPTAVCPGANVSLTATSGYTSYSWSNSLGTNSTATGVGPGTYSVSVSKTGYCGTGTATLTISQLPAVTAPTITPSASAACSNENINLVATAGYTSYSWSNSLGSNASATAIGAGTYTVTVAKTGECGTATASVTITSKPTVSNPVITPSSGVVCIGGGNNSVTFDAGTGFDSYAWSNATNTQTNTVTAAGNYTVSVTKTGFCGVGIATATVTATTLNCSVSSVGATFSVPVQAGATYQWYLDGQPITGATSNSYSATTAGAYTVQVTNGACNCTSSANVGFEEIGAYINYVIQPNPATDFVNIQYYLEKETSLRLNLVDVNGRIVKEIFTGTLQSGNYSNQVNLSELSSGIYIINVITDKGKATERIIKQ